MLSVCIPIYNFDVRPTVKELYKQLEQCAKPYEILLLDDASDKKTADINSELQTIDQVQYKVLNKNVGRSRIRNKLAAWAQYENILFLDCDVIIHNPSFISNYISALDTAPKVICGGRVYPDKCTSKEKMLRWKYGMQLESQIAAVRIQNPSKSFMTNNFLVSKDIFNHIQFNEALSEYGHEDTLFGYELKQMGIVPLHIENPVLNGDIETDAVFLQKTKQGLTNLSLLYNKFNNQPDFVHDITLLKFYSRLQRFKLLLMVLGNLNNVFLKAINLGIRNIRLFNLFKLSFFINQQLGK